MKIDGGGLCNFFGCKHQRTLATIMVHISLGARLP